MKKTFLLISFVLLSIFCFQLKPVYAQEPISDWIIRDFQSEIVVNKDSSLDITEKITADCDNLPGKHGIFRILPLISKTPDREFRTPVDLISITDFSGNPIKYSASKTADTVTWKIGDPNKLVHGINEYEIKYKVKNAIRSDSDFDELYWNLSGNLWQIDIDHFSAKVKLPSEINQNNSKLWVYSGSSNAKDDFYSTHRWENDNTIVFESNTQLPAGYGITMSLTFPKNIESPYVPTFLEKYGTIFGYIFFPFYALFLGFFFWKRYGDDPNIRKSITPEFDIPNDLSPAKIGTIFQNGAFDNKCFAASLIHMAVNKKITIEELQKKTTFKQADYEFKLNSKSAYKPDQIEQSIIDNFFGGPSFKLSDLRKDPKSFSKFTKVSGLAKDTIISEGYMDKNGFRMMGFMLLFYLVVSGSVLFTLFRLDADPSAMVSAIISIPIIAFFAFLMPKRTQEGAEIFWKIKGFKLYMKTAEKYRAEFNEKENIFEKYLPYAIMFGLTKQWIKKVESLQGSRYFSAYHPIWFVGDFASFDANSFASAIESVSSSVGTASGASGGGGAGGGGGGGGGGGW